MKIKNQILSFFFVISILIFFVEIIDEKILGNFFSGIGALVVEFILIIIIVLGLGSLFTKGITKRIVDLRKNVDEISKGNFSKTINVDYDDELGDLAKALKRITASMKLAIIRSGVDLSEMGSKELIKLASAKRNVLDSIKASENKYSEMIKKAIEGIVLIQDGVVISANNGMAKIFGMSIQSIEGKKVSELFSKDMIKIFEERSRMRKKGVMISDTFDVQIKQKLGALRDVEVSDEIILYKGRDSLMWVVRDITEKSQMLKKIREQYSKIELSNKECEIVSKRLQAADVKYNILLENIKVPIVLYKILNDGLSEPDLQVIETNQSYRKMLGITHKIITNKKVSNLVSKEIAKKIINNYSNIMIMKQKKVVKDIEFDGRKLHVIISPIDKRHVLSIYQKG